MLSQRSSGAFEKEDYMMHPRNATIDLRIIRKRLSPARLRRYEEATGHDLTAAVEYYLWNTDVSAAFYAVLQCVEVVLRNALAEQMDVLHRDRGYHGSWFDDPFDLLDDRHHEDIAQARSVLHRDGHPDTQDRMITVLSFGFWRFLLTSRYEHTLWIPALRKAFPHAPNGRRSYIASRVERLHHLRNRIAHHKPIYPRRLDRDMQEALEVVAAICPTSARWLEIYSWAEALLLNPIPTQRRRS
jgi:hypothetical protein